MKATVRIIPKHTTAMIQPLDVGIFRPWKNFERQISDRVLVDGLPFVLYKRDNILVLQSLIHNQFSAKRFKDFIKHAWYRSGYISERGGRFLTPDEFCFPDDLPDECEGHDEGGKCSEGAFIRCAHCESVLCFSHFFIDYHYHGN